MSTLIPDQAREYLLHKGPGYLSLEQAVALIIGTGSKGASVTGLSTKVASLLRGGETRLSALQEVYGLGLAKASALVAALQLYPLLHQRDLSDVLVAPEAVYEACRDLLLEPQEHLVVFFLDVRRRMVRREVVSIGTSTASVLHPREIFRAAIVHNAHSLILAHNHPSGDPSPSSADCAVTKRVFRAGEEVGIELLDHVICATHGWVSLKEQMPALFGSSTGSILVR
ncbi:MAG TPA: DNA repair protein RadC [Verrucomicrobiae bacterium]|nr:DNA repair protein RadC [Verrucomicrobiae bacterium]